EQMIGRRLETAKHREFSRGATENGAAPTLEVRGISSPGTASKSALGNVSLKVQAGEVVGIGGLVGCGRSELLNAIFGLDHKATGEVLVNGKAIDRHLARGFVIKPEDRIEQ